MTWLPHNLQHSIHVQRDSVKDSGALKMTTLHRPYMQLNLFIEYDIGNSKPTHYSRLGFLPRSSVEYDQKVRMCVAYLSHSCIHSCHHKSSDMYCACALVAAGLWDWLHSQSCPKNVSHSLHDWNERNIPHWLWHTRTRALFLVPLLFYGDIGGI